MPTTTAAFEIDLGPAGRDELDGVASRFEFTKAWTGGMSGSSRGFMASGGDPASGSAGYVALELFEGAVDGRSGTFLLQQYGVLAGGSQRLEYDVVPGSGTGDLVGLRGAVTLEIHDGEHRVSLDYEV